MPKNIEDIVVPVKKKSIRDIPLPENRRKSSSKSSSVSSKRTASNSAEESTEDTAESVMPRLRESRPSRSSRNRKKLGKKTLFSMFLGLVAVAFVAMAIFSGAVLSYTPKSASLSFAGESFSASKTGQGGLVFSVVKLSGEKGQSVKATGEEMVERKAHGTIIVYNNSGTAAQNLVENTRFETKDGKVYRIAEPITVPGKHTSDGESVPGSLEVEVYADKPGEEYNIGLSDFTLPGLAGSSKFNTVYARSKTAMSGGFVGKAKSVSDDDLAKAKSELETALKSELAEQAKAQVPADFVLFPSLSTISFEDMPQSDASGSAVTVNMKGNFYGVMFKRSDLAAYLASDKVNVAENDLVDIPDLDSLTLSFNGEPPADLLSVDNIDFTVNGEAQLVWKTDEESLKTDLAGIEKSQVSAVLNNYSSIKEADAVVRPFWKSRFPENIEDISIKKNLVQ